MAGPRKPRTTFISNFVKRYLKKGATIVELQKFLGGLEQYYRTILSYNGSKVVIYHKRPFIFIVQADDTPVFSRQLIVTNHDNPF